MYARLPILLGLIVFSFSSFIPMHECAGQHRWDKTDRLTPERWFQEMVYSHD